MRRSHGRYLSREPSRWTSLRKTPGRSTMKGEWFEVKTSALLYLRGLNSKQDFLLASNVEKARNFDDIVLKYKIPGDPTNWHTCFMQLKHKERASLSAVMLTEGERGGFSLKKYLKSYSNIKQKMINEDDELFCGSFEKCDFVIYTNANMDRDLAGRQRESSVGPLSSLLPSASGNENVVNFCETTDRDIYSAMSGSGPEGHEFLKKLTVFAGQPSEDKMNELIMEELKISCSDHMSDVDMIYRYFIEGVQEWWAEDQVVFLTPKSSLLKTAVDQYKAFNLTSQQKHDYRLKIKFQDFCLTNLKNEIRSLGALFCIVANPFTLKLSCTKVLQVLREEKDSYIFLGLDCLLSEREAVLSAWKNGRRRYLVVVSENSAEHLQLCEEITSIVFDNALHKKLVLLHVKNDIFTECIKRTLGVSYDVYQDSFDVSQLDQESNNFVTRKLVVFQTQPVYFKDLFNKCIPQAQSLIANNLSAIVNTDSLTIGSDVFLGDVTTTSHTLQRHDVLLRDLLQMNLSATPDTILVSGVSVEELKKMMPPGETVREYGSDDKDCHFLVATSAPLDAFNALSKTSTNLHWIEINKSLKWKMSKGNTGLIRQYIDDSSSTSSDLTSAVASTDRVFLVASNKSTILTDVGVKTKMAYPTTWVVRMNLDHHIDILRNVESEDINVISLLLTSLGLTEKTQLERDLFRFSLERAGNVVMLLDLTSATMTSCEAQVFPFLNNLLQTKLAKLWITCDLVSKGALETHLSTLAFDVANEKNLVSEQ